MTQSTVDSEVAEILKTLCANVAEDVNRNHPNYDWRIKHRVEAAQAITNLIAQEAKAFGGCRNCYGKGYATVISGTKGYADFGGDGFQTPPTTHIKYCSCDRGKQLQQVVAQEANKARIDELKRVEFVSSDNYTPLELVKSHIKDRIKALTAEKGSNNG